MCLIKKMERPLISSLLLCVIYRMSSVFIIQTSYVPDEYWQSLEVAHNMVFGYGYLTWEWEHGLRTYLYPSFFAIVYKFLEIFHMDFVYLIILIPKLLQAFLTAVSDQYFLLLCRNFKFDIYWAKVYLLTNWFWYYCGCRTIANTFETSLTVIALYHFPWNLFIEKKKEKNKFFDETLSEMRIKSLKYMTLSAINCLVRPTAVIIWGPLVILHLISLPIKKLKHIVLNCTLPVFFGVIISSTAVDFFWYGKIVVPAYNFLLFNIFKNISSFYGTHPFHWYITQGLPAVLGLQVLPFGLGFISLFIQLFTRANSSFKKIFAIWIFILTLNLLILSNIPHKEFRFLLPLLPLVTLIAVKKSADFFSTSKICTFLWTFVLILGFIIPTALFGIIHQRGPLQLMDYLSNAILKCTPQCSFLFLMPCHSTPLYSHLHVNVSIKFLTCEPPITDNFYDESKDFSNNPTLWLQKSWNDKNTPTHVALFDKVETLISPFLKRKGFIKKHDFFHTFFAEKNTGKYIVIYELS